MSKSCIYDILDNILPSSDETKHDILRLEYLSACQVMENKNDIMKTLSYIPVSLFEPLLRSVIYKCYLKFINIDVISIENLLDHVYENDIEFPKTLSSLILFWPHNELVLRNQIPPLHPPVKLFQNKDGPFASLKPSICQVKDMLDVFHKFCHRLIQFITQTIFNYTSRNTDGFSCNLRKLDVSGVGTFYNEEKLDDILKAIHDSNIDCFGHKIEIYADAVTSFSISNPIERLHKIAEENLNPGAGISVYFRQIIIVSGVSCKIPSDVYSVLARVRCEYIQRTGNIYNTEFAKKLYTYLPELVGLSIQFEQFDPLQYSTVQMESVDFLSSFEYLEDISLRKIRNVGFVHSITNIKKGLKSLDLSSCSLHVNDLESLANSIHSETLLELDISGNEIGNDAQAVGLVNLCQKLKNVKVLKIEVCSLESLSSNSVSHLVGSFKHCVHLEFLSFNKNPFSLDITNMIIECLAHNTSLRYLSLNLPDENIEYQPTLCKTLHETINKCRNSPIYISWNLVFGGVAI